MYFPQFLPPTYCENVMAVLCAHFLAKPVLSRIISSWHVGQPGKTPISGIC